MPAEPTLSRLLSQVLIAYTIEFDNEWEREMTAAGRLRLFATSLVMWANFMRFVPVEGVRVRELQSLSRVSSSGIDSRLGALKRWGYVTVEPPDADSAGARSPMRGWIVRPTPRGLKAQSVWRPLNGTIEKRWRTRFGDDEVDTLGRFLRFFVDKLDIALPHYLPIAGYGLSTEIEPIDSTPDRPDRDDPSQLDLSALLAQVLLAFTLEFEADSEISLAIGANVLRVLDASGVRVRDLPGLTGICKETVAVSTGFLERHGYAAIVPEPGVSRGSLAQLTPKGTAAQSAVRSRVEAVEKRWKSFFGKAQLDGLRGALQRILEQRDGERLRLSQGLVPPPGGWRARARYLPQTKAFMHDPEGTLPCHPTVTHRGGWPDGS